MLNKPKPNLSKTLSKTLSKSLSKTIGKLIIPFLVLVLVAMFSAGCFQDLLIPVYIGPEAKEYDPARIAAGDANDLSNMGSITSIFPWPTLWDAKQLAKRMQRKNEVEQRDVGRLLVDKASHYAYVAKGHYSNIEDAEQFKRTAFSPTGPIGLLVPTLAAFGIGAMGVSKRSDTQKLKAKDKVIVDLEKTNVAIVNKGVTETTSVS